ncbi:hypothetical protein [Streptomyces sp. NPDC001286]
MSDDGSYVGDDEELPPKTPRYEDDQQSVESAFTLDASFVMTNRDGDVQRDMPATFEVQVLANGHWRVHMEVAPETGVHASEVNRWLVGLNPGYLSYEGTRYQIEYHQDQMDGPHGGFINTSYGVNGVSPPEAPAPPSTSTSPSSWWRRLFRRGGA